jgi:2-polyprenyl-3-methyl-5-hydroxy-6-metoxy-1,4-benzoquinol methylase
VRPPGPRVSAADPAAGIAASWDANAAAWTGAVRSGAIASRRLATDAAILAAVLARRPRRVLDLGCGEGWLARALAAERVETVGIDGSAALVEAAARAAAGGGGGTFLRLSYEELVADPAAAGTGFDVVAANFALLAEDAAPLLRALRRPDGPLAPGGALVVQTLHPLAAGPPYRDGWRTEDFRGFGGGEGGGWRPMPWYFRTLGSWVALLREAGYALAELREPAHPETHAPLSLLITAEPSPPCSAAPSSR